MIFCREAPIDQAKYRIVFLLTVAVVFAFIITVVYSVGSSEQDVQMPNIMVSFWTLLKIRLQILNLPILAGQRDS